MEAPEAWKTALKMAAIQRVFDKFLDEAPLEKLQEFARACEMRIALRKRLDAAKAHDAAKGHPTEVFVAPSTNAACTHGLVFDVDAARGLSVEEVRKRWPRLMGTCPKGCGFHGIAYVSMVHYVYGDW